MSATILCDRQIRQLANHCMIMPFSEGVKVPGVLSYGLGPFGYDARLGRKFKVVKSWVEGVIDPKNFDVSCMNDVDVPSGETFVLPPHGFALGVTVEKFTMPCDVTALVLGKSSMARAGLCVNATPLEAGWTGFITLELANLTPLPIRLYPDEGIVQVLFFRGEKPEADYTMRGGRYNGQVGPTLPTVA